MDRPLLSHCITALDLYKTYDCKKKIPGCRKIVKKYGGDRLQYLCRTMFIYCFYLVLLDIVENNANFTLPLKRGARAQLYTRASTGEDLQRLVKYGKFADRDLLETNFVGYSIEFYTECKKSSYHKTVYVDRKLKAKLLERVKKDPLPLKMTKVDDYLPYVYETFPDVPQESVKKAIEHGFMMYYYLQIQGHDTLITNRLNYPYSAYCGKMLYDRYEMIGYWQKKFRHKIHAEYMVDHKDKPWQGCYYFGLNKENYEKYIPNKSGRIKQKVLFPKLVLYKARREAYMDSYIDYVFKIPWKEDEGWCIFTENFETRNFELIGVRDKRKKMHFRE